MFLFLHTSAAHAQWVFIDTGSTRTTDLAVEGNVQIVTCGASSCGAPAYVSTDGGSTWQSQFPGTGAGRNVSASAQGFVAQFEGQEDYTVSADGSVWTSVPGPPSNTTSYFFDRPSDRLYATTQSQNLVFSDDSGATWTNAGVPNPRDGELSFVHVRDQTILTGYNQGGGGTFLSTDGGSTWTELDRTQPKGGFIGEDGDLYVAQNVNVSLVTPSTALFRSEDGGTTWTRLFAAPGVGIQGRGTPLRTRMSIYASGPTLLFTANDRVYVSTDDGLTWEDKSEGILPNDVNATAAVSFHIEDGTASLVLWSNRGSGASSGYGLYQRPLAELGLLATSAEAPREAPREAPDGLSLLDPIPNPVRDDTSIRYELPAGGHVRLTVFDAQGRRIGTPVDAWRPSGPSEHVWRSGDLAPGL